MPQASIFEGIFGKPLASLPPVMQKHYAIRPDSTDRAVAHGTMNIRRSRLMRLLSPLSRLFGVLVPYDGDGVPVTVDYYSGPGDKTFHFDRLFHLPGGPFRFHSRVQAQDGNEAIEIMRGGIGWRCAYEVDGNYIRFRHRGYVFHLGGIFIPVPLALFFGVGAAEEEVLSDDTFKMWMTVTHPLFGENYRYEGTFRVTEVPTA